MAVDTLGDLTITSGVDTSGLAEGLDAAVAKVQQASDSMASAMGGAETATAGLGDSFGNIAAPADQFSSAAQKIIDTQDRLQLKVEALQGALQELQAGYDAGTVSAEALQRAQDQLDAATAKAYGTLDDPAPEEAASAFGELAEKVIAFGEALAITEGLKEFITEALSAYSAVQQFSASMGALTGSGEAAENVLSNIEHIAATQPFSFPELAGAAQQLAAFGVDAEQLPGILQTAADVSRATGNSFDAIASALGRVELSGQVSARQLVQLGLSWQDLADAAGVSVDQVQELLKKGGQDAEADLDLLLKAAEDKFSAFGQVPLSIGQQWIVLENQMHQVFAAIGEAIAPVIQSILSGFQDYILPTVKDALAAFNALPGPVKDVAVAAGLLVAAAAPLAAALGALGLGIAGLQAAIPMVTEALGVFGIQLGSTAAEEATAAAGATELAAAEAEVATASTTAAEGVGAFGLASKLVGWAAIAGEILLVVDALNKDYDAYTKMKQAQDDAAATDKTYQAGLQRTYEALEQATVGHIALNSQLDIAHDKWVSGQMSADAFNKTLRDVSNGLQGTTDAAKSLSGGAQDVVDHIQTLQDNLAHAKAVLAELKSTLDDSAKSHQILAQAEADVEKASTALYGAAKPLVQVFDDLQFNAQKATDKLTDSKAVLDEVQQKYQAGLASVQALGLAQKQYTDALNAFNSAATTLQGTEDSLINKQNQLEAAARNNVQVVLDLAKSYEDGSPIIQKALDAAVTSMKAAGLEMDDITQKPAAWSVEVIKAGKVVQTASDDTRTVLENMIHAMDPDGVSASGAWQAKTLTALEAAAEGVKAYSTDTVTAAGVAGNALGDLATPLNATLELVKVNGQTMAQWATQTDAATSQMGAGFEVLAGTHIPKVKAAIDDCTTATQQMLAAAADASQAIANGMFTATSAVNGLDQAVQQTIADLNSATGAAGSFSSSIGGATGGKTSLGNPFMASTTQGVTQAYDQYVTNLKFADPMTEQIFLQGLQPLLRAAYLAASIQQQSSGSSTSSAVSSATKAVTTAAGGTTSPTTGTSTGNALLDFLNNFTTAVTAATSAAAGSGSSTALPDWVQQLSDAVQALNTQTTQAGSAQSLPDWVTQLATTIQQFTGSGQSVVDMTQLGNAVEGVISQIPQVTTAVNQVAQVQQTVLAGVAPLTTLTQSVTGLATAATAATAALNSPSFQQGPSNIAGINNALNTLGVPTGTAVFMPNTAPAAPTSGNYAYPGMPGYVPPLYSIPATPNLNGTMSQVTNSSNSSQISIGQVNLTGPDATDLMQRFVTVLQRSGVRM